MYGFSTTKLIRIMRKLKSKTQKIYDRARKVTRGYFNRKPSNLEAIPKFFTYAERYFLNVSNYNGILFIRKNLLRCYLHKAKVQKNIEISLMVDKSAVELITIARHRKIIKPSYSKLAIQAKTNLIKLLICEGRDSEAEKQINLGLNELEVSKVEFPNYFKNDISESDLMHLERMLLKRCS